MMQALVNYSGTPGSVELRDVPKPQIRPGEVLLRSRGIGICGSDLHQWHGTQAWAVNWPVTLGHEFCGEVVEVGSDVTGWHVGDRVACETAARVCGHCPMCRTGHYNLCPHVRFFATPPYDGAFSQFVAMPAAFVYPVPDTISDDAAGLLEPLSVGIWACRRTQLAPGIQL
jgi:threonine dehydrogenase-like Zn-dependent dehydrogenase